jgi:predicted amidohydrolase
MALVNPKCLYSDGADATQNAAHLKANLARHLYFIDRATAEGAEFVGFPELSLNGYHFSERMTWLKLDGPEVQGLAAKAKEKKIYVSAGLAEEDASGKHWNTQIDPLRPTAKSSANTTRSISRRKKGSRRPAPSTRFSK